MKMKKIIMLTLSVVLLIAGIALIAKSIMDIVPDIIAKQESTALADEIHNASGNDANNNSSDNNSQETNNDINWDVVQEKVPNTKSWLKIQGTHIDNPVAQATEDDPDYWLSHNINGYYSQSGTIFFGEESNDKVNIIYGHKMNMYGLMFNELGDKADQASFNNLGNVLLWTKETGLEGYTPVAAQRVNAHETDLRNVPSMTNENRIEWAKQFYNNASATDSVNWDAVKDKKLLFLVTCSGYARYGHDIRTVILCVQN